MKTTKLLACLLFGSLVMHGQEAIPASGGVATGSGGSSSYSVGQMVYTTNTGSDTVFQGVQQSIELYVLSNKALTTVNLNAATYPNPTTDFVVLTVSDSNLSNLSYVLYDLQGRTVAKGKAQQANTQIAMHSLPTGTYVLKLNQNNQEIKTFKIIKK
jgi:hypothetical protein